MKKIKICTLLLIGFLCIYMIYDHYNIEYIVDGNINKEEKEEVNHNKNNNVDNKFIDKLQQKYKNNDIVLYLSIPNVVEMPIVRGNNNSYYLTHDAYKQEQKAGHPFLDYRIKSLDSKKLIIYGHNSTYRTLPFTILTKYKNEEFYKQHPNIYIYTNKGKKKYKIFSSYIESKDFDYVNLKDFNGLTYYEHLLKLKNKSLYETNVKVKEDSKIIIIQTCTFDNKSNSNINYQLILGVLEEE